MLTPLNIMSLDQGKDLAHWHIHRLYGEPINPDIDRSEESAEVPVPAPVDAIAAPREPGIFLAILIWCWKTTRPTILRRSPGKDCEISAA